MRFARKVLEAPLSERDRRRLLRLAHSGVELDHLQWAFGAPAAALEAALEAARRDFAPAARPPANDNRAPPSPAPVHAPPIERALETLGARAAETGRGLWLDGALTRGADLVAAARALGADIAYPGIAPLPKAFHTGPSALPRKRRRGG